MSVSDWFGSIETPRWMIIAGFVGSSLLTVGLNTCSSIIVESHKRTDTARSEQARALTDTMIQFQTFASAFSAEMFKDKKPSQETKTNILKNLNEQMSRARAVEAFMPEKQTIRQYMAAVANMSNVVEDTNDVQSMKQFWSAASTLLMERNKVTLSLQSYI